MKEYVMLKGKKYRKNVVNYENNKIVVTHNNLLTPSRDFSLLDSLIKDDGVSIDTNKVVAEYYNLYSAYCPKYLKTKLKNLNNKDDNYVIDKFEIELKKRFKTYTSIYYEDELIKINKNFGESIFNLISNNCNNLWNIINVNNENVVQTFTINIITHISKDKLERTINDHIYKYGTNVLINRKNRKSIWNDYIYTSVMTYLIISFIEILYSKIFSFEDKKREFSKILKKLSIPKEQKIDINEIIKRLFYSLKKLEEKNLKSFCKNSEIKVITLEKDTKIIRNIQNLIGYVIFYLENHYFEDYEYYKTESLISCLENHREYLISLNNFKAISYSYEELEESYRRKILNY